MHLDDGTLRATLDHQLSIDELARIRSHLESCDRCADRLEQIRSNADRVSQLGSSAWEKVHMPPGSTAYAKLESIASERESSMWKRFTGKEARPVYAGLAVAALFIIALSIPQVRTMASEFLALFRVERITTIDIGLSLEEVPDEFERYFTTADRILGEDLILEGFNDELAEAYQVRDQSAASSEVGFAVRLPRKLESEPRMMVQPGADMSITIDRERWQLLLEELGYGDYALAESLDGKQVSITAPASVAALYGECEEVEEDDRIASTASCTVLLQGRSPIVEAPPEFDIQQLGAIALQLLGLDKDDAEAFSVNIDWTSTLVIPIPKGADYQKVSVDGVDGVLLEDPYKDAKTRLTVLWLKGGILYSLYGEMEPEEALQIVNSLE